MFRRKIRNSSNGGISIFIFTVLHRDFWERHHFKRGGITALFSHMVGMRIPLQCLPPVHTWEEPEHSYGVVCQRFFSLLTEKLYCLPAWKCLWKLVISTSGIHFWECYANQTVEQVTDLLLHYGPNLRPEIQLQQIFKVLQYSWEIPKCFILTSAGSSWKLLFKTRIDSLVSKIALVKSHLEAQVGFFDVS